MISRICEEEIVQRAIENYIASLAVVGITLRLRRNFIRYAAVRAAHGDRHLNQAFDPQYIKFGDDDFWILAENRLGEAVATYCVRRFRTADFYDVIRSQALWFGDRLRLVDQRFVVACRIPPFGGEVAHGGGLWVRRDYRGSRRLAAALPRLARAIALRNSKIDHDSAMIRNDPEDSPALADRKAAFMAIRVYGFARVDRFVDGWFPPEGRNAIMHLCHATRSEAVASLAAPLDESAARGSRQVQFPQSALVDEDQQLIDPPAVGGKRQQQARV